jgi:hypothetical protein
VNSLPKQRIECDGAGCDYKRVNVYLRLFHDGWNYGILQKLGWLKST